ncbi:hypothetical protein TTRE_0000349501 [Trichuris trichiura]|uniref:Uncharacterized protein n=1 Tax=Trichuris trichiura TaxID=36087 RepID=A0A077Z6I4_TRITR|nr:hypothetical protein TTRE_0000349501 [Trichuris trichiura]
MNNRDVSIQVDSFYENLSLEELKRCCFTDDKLVQSAISRNIVDRIEKVSCELTFLSGILDDIPLFMLQTHVMMAFAAVSYQAKRGLKLVRESVTLPAPRHVKNRMSVDNLIVVTNAITMLRSAELYLHRIEEVQEFADELDIALLYIEFEQAAWLSQIEYGPTGSHRA